MNVGINLPGISDAAFVEEMRREAAAIRAETRRLRSPGSSPRSRRESETKSQSAPSPQPSVRPRQCRGSSLVSRRLIPPAGPPERPAASLGVVAGPASRAPAIRRCLLASRSPCGSPSGRSSRIILSFALRSSTRSNTSPGPPRIAAGDLRWPAPPPHGPGYPFFLAGVFRLFPGSLPAASVAQALLGASTCVAVAALAGIWFGPLAAWAAGLLLAFNGVVAWTDISLLAEGLLLLLMTGALLCLGKAPVTFGRRRPGRPPHGSCGARAADRSRPAADRPGHSRSPRRVESGAAFRMAGLAAGAAGLVLLPVTVANWRASGAPLLVQGHGGFNFSIGNSPSGHRASRPSVPAPAGTASKPKRRATAFGSPAEQDRYFFRKTLAEISASPLAWLRLLGRKLLWTIQADEIRDSFSFSFFEKASPAPRGAARVSVCSFRSRSRASSSSARARPRPALLFAGAAATAGACVLLVTSSRYRLPFVVALVPFAAAGLVSCLRMLRERSPRAAVLAASSSAGVALCRIARHAPSHVHAEEWSATGYALIHLRESDDADKAFRKAIAEDARWSPAWAGLGVVAGNRGDLAGAESLFREGAPSPAGQSRRAGGVGRPARAPSAGSPTRRSSIAALSRPRRAIPSSAGRSSARCWRRAACPKP